MKKIFLLGMSPLPFENDKKVYGTGIRTWQFVLPLLEKGFRICVCNYAIPSAYQDDFKSVFKKHIAKDCGYNFEYHILKKDDFENIGLLSKIFTKFEPDCIIGCTFYPSYMASRMLNDLKDRSVPFWADLFGHVMAEAQARANIDKSDDCLFHYWNSEYNILSTADVFSCVSSRQQYALIGELGAAGRLNKYTAGYDFASVIPCGIPRERYRHTSDVIRGRDGIKKDDFIVLWTGGYNTWTDVDTLFKGLTIAMSKNPKVKFVSTGGEIPEQDIKTYPRFLSMIKSSPFRDRFVMKGWIRGNDVPNYYLEADVGINIDKDIYEVRLGSKNRIMDWLRAGLCVLSSNVCELTDLIEKEKIGYTFKPYDYKELGSKIIYLAGHLEDVKRTADVGAKYGLENFNFERTTLKLQKWAARPSYSPDKGKERKLFFKREEAVKNLVKITLGQKKMIEERDRRISELEGIVKKSLVYKIYSYLKIIKRKMSR
jgi:glycosyltransferase involved in cell wall biosynthesis